MKKVSIIIPTYNSEIYIDKLLNNVASIEFEGFEVIIVDDGSTDKTYELIQEFIEKNANEKLDIKCRRLEKNSHGPGKPRNIALEMSLGEYVMFLDSDDAVTKDCLSNLYEEAVRTGSDITIGKVNAFKNGIIYKYSAYDKLYKVKKVGAKELMAKTAPWAMLFKKAFLDKNKFCFREGVIYEDYAPICKLYFNSPKVGLVDKVCYYYRIRGEGENKSVTQDLNLKAFKDFLQLLVELRSTLGNKLTISHLLSYFSSNVQVTRDTGRVSFVCKPKLLGSIDQIGNLKYDENVIFDDAVLNQIGKYNKKRFAFHKMNS